MVSEKLLGDVRNYLDITYKDEEADKKLIGIIERGIAFLDNVAGDKQNYDLEGPHRALLFDYCRYARNNAAELFEQSFRSELISLRIGVQADEYAEQQGYV